MDKLMEKYLAKCVEMQASDLHLSSDAYVYVRVSGSLKTISDNHLSAEDVRRIFDSMLSDKQKEALRDTGAVDIAFSIKNSERFRGHIYKEKCGLTMAARKLEDRFRSLDELGLPDGISELAGLRDGLVLFTGPTGSGKSTTLATLIDQINRTRFCHILTIEDPIEYIHPNKSSLVHQREVLRDVNGFAEAVRGALREDPDVLLVGEMRDVETMRAAITVAETGHLVFSTLHCNNAVGALDRLIGAFDANERESLCQQLSMTLRAVVAQHLIPKANGEGRIPSIEILRVTKGVANLIRNHKSEQLYTSMESGGESGMQTLEKSLADLVNKGDITADAARMITENPRILEQRIKSYSGISPGGCY